MSAAKLALVKVIENVASEPAAYHELAAARYCGLNRTSFRKLVFAGLIPFTTHVNGVRRLYLRADLDAYLASLPRRTMARRESSPPALKGVGSK